jgi:hypothetical protein
MRACGWPSRAQATAVSPCRRCLASLPLRAPEHPLPHGTRGHLSGVGQGRDTSSRDMAFPSACPCGTSRGLHPRAPLPLLYPSLCRMSSPSNRRAAPLLLAGGIGVQREDQRPHLPGPFPAPAHQGFQAATLPKPTVRPSVRERLSRQSTLSRKTLIASFQGFANHALSHCAILFRKVAEHDHQTVA